MAKSYKEIMNDISTFIFDVDGVLTDSSVFVTNEEKFFVL
jgi:3-deoxy-D-manno-octulosonate 8-phosphate phosphatase (KDO 8-P phosphatase)